MLIHTESLRTRVNPLHKRLSMQLLSPTDVPCDDESFSVKRLPENNHACLTEMD
jgi:hypothetical protein